MVVAIVFIGLLLLQIPISIVLGMTGISYILTSGSFGLLQSVPQNIYSGLESHGLLAIPLFMLAGELMNFGGITTRLIRFSKTVVGHYKGGLAYVNVLANMFLASILGSSLAQTAVMSRVMVPAMEKEGYKREFSAATTAAAAMLGPIIPPSMIFIIYSVGSGTSIGAMFLAGIMPGILLAASFIALIAYFGYSLDLPKSPREPFKNVVVSFLKMIPALCVPGVIIFGILGGIFTATESAAIACFISFIVGFLLYRELKFKDIPNILVNTAVTTGTVTFLIAMAHLFGLVITFERIPQMITDWMVTLTQSPLVFLLLVNIFLIFVGMVMDGIAALIILVPIVVPLAVEFGIDPIHLGIVICLNMVIGSLTPPVGAGLFIASSIGEVKYERLVRAMWPFLLIALVNLIIITYWPQMVLWIPDMFAPK